jgi:SAM-dependent methyltransferase
VLRVAGPLTRRLQALTQSMKTLTLSVATQSQQVEALRAAHAQADTERVELRMRQDEDAREFATRLGQFAAAQEQLSRRQADDASDLAGQLREHISVQQELFRQQTEAVQVLATHSRQHAEALRLHAERLEQAQHTLSAALRETQAGIEAGWISQEERAQNAEQTLARIAGELAAAAGGLRRIHAWLETEDRRREFPAGQDFNYTAFEDIFRGSESLIRERQAVYLPLLKTHAPVIDLGCGRGELLELLGQAGVEARGVESNEQQAARCRAKGLPVEVTDLRGWLDGRGAASAGGITLLQVIEHLPPDEFMPVIRNIHRVLRPGGIMLLETVNPHCAAAMEWFYIDPTHRRPVYPEMLQFLLGGAGFSAIGIRYLCPAAGAPAGAPPDSVTGMDYAIWGYKA